MPVSTPAGKSGMWKSRLKPSAAPRNSARSVAMATHLGDAPHAPDDRARELVATHLGQVRPVAMPSLAESDWISIAIRLLATMTQTSR